MLFGSAHAKGVIFSPLRRANTLIIFKCLMTSSHYVSFNFQPYTYALPGAAAETMMMVEWPETDENTWSCYIVWPQLTSCPRMAFFS